MKPGVEFTRFYETELAGVQGILRKDLVPSANLYSWVSTFKLNHVFTVLFFNDQIRKNLFAQIEQSKSGYYPVEDVPFEFSGACTSGARRFGSFECFFQPINQPFVCIRDFQDSSVMIVDVSIPRFFGKDTDMETSFTIDDSCQIGKIKRWKSFKDILLSIWVAFGDHFEPPFKITEQGATGRIKCLG